MSSTHAGEVAKMLLQDLKSQLTEQAEPFVPDNLIHFNSSGNPIVQAEVVDETDETEYDSDEDQEFAQALSLLAKSRKLLINIDKFLDARNIKLHDDLEHFLHRSRCGRVCRLL
jgi:hypothetical protein